MSGTGAFLISTLTLLLLSSCARGGPGRPPEIRYGQDVCEQCGMIISDERYAPAYVTTGGTARKFDDIGDMATYHASHREDVALFWVHDSDSREWMRAETAHYVFAVGVRTPMSHGLAAYSTTERAAQVAAQMDGSLLEWDGLLEKYGAPGGAGQAAGETAVASP